ncbi:MAG: cobalt-precorrin-6A reductase [Rhodospirillales bacterium]|nr:cobalt-precorrin-6A reductase [Rhodospirillales bacterium]
MPDNAKKHLLILGGTSEARTLARRLTIELSKKIRVTTSLAGRRAKIPTLPGELRIGGFGGVEGMKDYIADNAVDFVVDATHPFSPKISANANFACLGAAIPRVQLVRPLWKMPPGADWIEVDDMAGVAEILPSFAKRVFMTTGARGFEELSGLENLWFLVRMIDPPKDPLPLKSYTLARGSPPYSLEGERAILAEHDIDTLVSKYSGGEATAAKIFAASEANVKIVLINRPPPEPGVVVETVNDAFAWVAAQV